MNPMAAHPQRIDRLTPLPQAFDWIDRVVSPVPPRQTALAQALGRILVEDVVVATSRPLRDLSWRDGWGLRSDDTIDAGGYAPANLSRAPVRLDVGDVLPEGLDAVAPIDAVDPVQQVALSVVAPGEGVLARGADAVASEILKRAGMPLRRTDLVAFSLLGMTEVGVRAPRVHILAMRNDAIIGAIASFIADAVTAAGGVGERSDSIQTWIDAEADALIAVGGTGSGRTDASIRSIDAIGGIDIHGIALTPGDSAALGRVGHRPVLLVPGRLDAALAVWLLLGRRMVARLCGSPVDEPTSPALLTAKITSSLGLAELVLLRRDRDGMMPLATGHLPLAALAAADAYLLVPPDSEGYPAGARIDTKALP